MKLYTINSGSCYEGIEVVTFQFQNSEIKIPAVLVGENGRGSKLGVLPINLCQNSFKEWQEKGKTSILFANLGKTKSGKPKLFQTDKDETPDNFCASFYTKIGFRGGNNHTGDISGEFEKDYFGAEKPKYLNFPAEIIADGIISQGAAGRMGSGEQYVAILPYNTVFRTAYSGRLYGDPPAHFYYHNKEKLLVATQEEREASDIF